MNKIIKFEDILAEDRAVALWMKKKDAMKSPKYAINSVPKTRDASLDEIAAIRCLTLPLY